MHTRGSCARFNSISDSIRLLCAHTCSANKVWTLNRVPASAYRKGIDKNLPLSLNLTAIFQNYDWIENKVKRSASNAGSNFFSYSKIYWLNFITRGKNRYASYIWAKIFVSNFLFSFILWKMEMKTQDTYPYPWFSFIFSPMTNEPMNTATASYSTSVTTTNTTHMRSARTCKRMHTFGLHDLYSISKANGDEMKEKTSFGGRQCHNFTSYRSKYERNQCTPPTVDSVCERN